MKANNAYKSEPFSWIFICMRYMYQTPAQQAEISGLPVESSSRIYFVLEPAWTWEEVTGDSNWTEMVPTTNPKHLSSLAACWLDINHFYATKDQEWAWDQAAIDAVKYGMSLSYYNSSPPAAILSSPPPLTWGFLSISRILLTLDSSNWNTYFFRRGRNKEILLLRNRYNSMSHVDPGSSAAALQLHPQGSTFKGEKVILWTYYTPLLSWSFACVYLLPPAMQDTRACLIVVIICAPYGSSASAITDSQDDTIVDEYRTWFRCG